MRGKQNKYMNFKTEWIRRLGQYLGEIVRDREM